MTRRRIGEPAELAALGWIVAWLVLAIALLPVCCALVTWGAQLT